jgi:hypothetical protein
MLQAWKKHEIRTCCFLPSVRISVRECTCLWYESPYVPAHTHTHTHTPNFNAVVTFWKARRKLNFSQVVIKKSVRKPNSSTLEPDRRQCNCFAACRIAQQYSSSTSVSLHFYFRKEKFGGCLKCYCSIYVTVLNLRVWKCVTWNCVGRRVSVSASLLHISRALTGDVTPASAWDANYQILNFCFCCCRIFGKKLQKS